MRREVEGEAGSRDPGTPSALGSGGSRLGRTDPSRRAHPHPEGGHPRARPRAGPGLSSATSCWWPGLGRVPPPPLGRASVGFGALARSSQEPECRPGPAPCPSEAVARPCMLPVTTRVPSSVCPRDYEPPQPPDFPGPRSPGTPFLLSPPGPTSSEQIMKTGAFLLQG